MAFYYPTAAYETPYAVDTSFYGPSGVDQWTADSVQQLMNIDFDMPLQDDPFGMGPPPHTGFSNAHAKPQYDTYASMTNMTFADEFVQQFSAPSYVTPPQYNSGYLYPGHSSVFPEHALTAFAPSPISSSSASSMSVSRSVSPFSSPLSSAPSTLASHLPSPANIPAPAAHSSKPSWLTPSGCGACQGTHEWQHGVATSSRELRSVWSADHTWECGFPDGQGGFCQHRLSGRSKPELNSHMRATHGWPSNGDEMMHCPFASVCKHGQKKAESMAQHIMDIHWASTMVECTHCLQTFTRATSGHRHINDSVLQCNRQHTLTTVKGQICPPPNPRIPNDASVLVTKKGKKTTMQLNAPTDASSKTSRKLVRGGDDDNYVDNTPSGSRHTRSSSRQLKRELDDSHVTSIFASRSSRNDVRSRPY